MSEVTFLGSGESSLSDHRGTKRHRNKKQWVDKDKRLEKSLSWHAWPITTYREVYVIRNTQQKHKLYNRPGRGKKTVRKPKENDQQHRTSKETQGPCPGLMGFCTSAPIVCLQRRRHGWRGLLVQDPLLHDDARIPQRGFHAIVTHLCLPVRG